MLVRKKVVTCFLESDGEILILRRSERVGSYQGRWAGVSGYVETTADEQAFTEIREEAGLSGEDIKLIKRGKPLIVEDDKLGVKWIVYPYLFHIEDRDRIKIDWEHKEIRWILAKDIGSYETVPELEKALFRVY